MSLRRFNLQTISKKTGEGLHLRATRLSGELPLRRKLADLSYRLTRKEVVETERNERSDVARLCALCCENSQEAYT